MKRGILFFKYNLTHLQRVVIFCLIECHFNLKFLCSLKIQEYKENIYLDIFSTILILCVLYKIEK